MSIVGNYYRRDGNHDKYSLKSNPRELFTINIIYSLLGDKTKDTLIHPYSTNYITPVRWSISVNGSTLWIYHQFTRKDEKRMMSY